MMGFFERIHQSWALHTFGRYGICYHDVSQWPDDNKPVTSNDLKIQGCIIFTHTLCLLFLVDVEFALDLLVYWAFIVVVLSCMSQFVHQVIWGAVVFTSNPIVLPPMGADGVSAVIFLGSFLTPVMILWVSNLTGFTKYGGYYTL